jgi:hypothetical protein
MRKMPWTPREQERFWAGVVVGFVLGVIAVLGPALAMDWWGF